MSYSILSNTLVASAGRVINIILGIVIVAAVSRYLGAAQYGRYSLLLAYGSLWQIAADFGLYLALTRDIARYPDRQQKILSLITAVRLALLITMFGTAGVIVFYLPGYRALLPAFAIVALGLVFQSFSQLLMGVYQAHGVIWRATAGDLLGRVVQLIGVFLFPLAVFYNFQLQTAHYQLLYMAATFTAGLAVAYFFHAVLVPAVQPWRVALNWRQLKRIVINAWPLAGMLVLNVIYFRIDIVMLAYWRPEAEVGWYGLAYRIVESLLFFPAMFGGLLLPNVSALISRNAGRAKALLEQSLRFVAVAAAFTGVALVMLARPTVEFLSGEQFEPAASLLQVLAGALVIMFFGNVFGFALVALNKQKQLLILYALLAGGNVVSNALLIPVYGALAAAWTTVATEAVAAGAAAILVWWVLPYRLTATVVMQVIILAAATALFALVEPAQWHVLVRFVLAAIFYGAGCVLLGLIRSSHIGLLLVSKRP